MRCTQYSKHSRAARQLGSQAARQLGKRATRRSFQLTWTRVTTETQFEELHWLSFSFSFREPLDTLLPEDDDSDDGRDTPRNRSTQLARARRRSFLALTFAPRPHPRIGNPRATPARRKTHGSAFVTQPRTSGLQTTTTMSIVGSNSAIPLRTRKN